MKKLILSIAVCFLIATGFAQNLAKITIGREGNTDNISFALETNIFLYLNKDGSIKKFGYDRYAAFGAENYGDELDEYVGRVEYYTPNDDIAFRGKVKYIGKYLITYYASYDNDDLKGKVKSIGTINLDYYRSFDDAVFKGYIKTVGQQQFTWYGSFDNAGSKGKLKSVGPTQFTYYGAFDDKAYSGKIKSLGSITFTWYSSFDLKEYRGAMKTGTQLQTINGVKYFVRG